MLWSMIKTWLTEPGEIPSELKGSELDDNQLYLMRKMSTQKGPFDAQNNKFNIFQAVLVDHVETKNKRGFLGKPRYCKSCKAYKPDRCHHCSVCNKCVLKMDHHCPFINNCIGFFNYKYFLLMIFYKFCLLFQLVITVNSEFQKVINDCSVIIYIFRFIIKIVSASKVYYNYFCLSFNSNNIFGHYYIFSVPLSVEFIYQSLIIKSLTTIEFREKMSNKNDVSPYKQSLGYNLKMIFGSNPLFWLLPIKPNYEGNGLVFKRAKQGKKTQKFQKPRNVDLEIDID